MQAVIENSTALINRFWTDHKRPTEQEYKKLLFDSQITWYEVNLIHAYQIIKALNEVSKINGDLKTKPLHYDTEQLKLADSILADVEERISIMDKSRIKERPNVIDLKSYTDMKEPRRGAEVPVDHFALSVALLIEVEAGLQHVFDLLETLRCGFDTVHKCSTHGKTAPVFDIGLFRDVLDCGLHRSVVVPANGECAVLDGWPGIGIEEEAGMIGSDLRQPGLVRVRTEPDAR